MPKNLFKKDEKSSPAKRIRKDKTIRFQRGGTNGKYLYFNHNMDGSVTVIIKNKISFGELGFYISPNQVPKLARFLGRKKPVTVSKTKIIDSDKQ
ncbi:MAG: hypothetical protein QQN41_01400 [Nitrosopumilus sp.]